MITMRKTEQGRSPALPIDVTEEILSRLPMKSLMRFRFVSKQWQSLFLDPGFITKHMNRSTVKNPTHILVEYPSGLYTSKIESLTQMRKFHLLFKEWPSTRVHVEALCDGLVCLSFESSVFQEVRLFNPFTRECQILPKDYCFNYYSCYSCFGLGFDPKIKEYKVVKVTYMDEFVSGTQYSQTSIKIYTLGSHRWRRIRRSLPLKIYQSRNASLNGAVHWVAFPKDRGVFGPASSLLSFDFHQEVFKEVLLPEFGIRNAVLDLGVGVLEGCLTVSAHFRDFVEIWVMKEYGVKESWTKLFSMRSMGIDGYTNVLLVGFLKDGEILLQMDKDKLILYNPESQTETKLGFRSFPYFNCYGFVESLVCPRVGSGEATKS